MNITNEVIERLTKKIYLAKLRLLSNYGFFGSLLIGMNFVLVTEDKIIKNSTGAATDGKTIYFKPEELDAYSNQELDIVIMHELLHIALKHVYRGKRFNKEKYNRACDIVVNSNIKHCLGLTKNEPLVVQGIPLEHKTPTGKEGKLYSAEEVYDMLIDADMLGDKPSKKKSQSGDSKSSSNSDSKSDDNSDDSDKSQKGSGNNIDDHTTWDQVEEMNEYEEDLLDQRILKAFEIAKAQDASRGRGTIPLGIERQIKELREPQIDWKEYLQAFIQENVVDYSFSPPDRRFQDSDFILPDLNDAEVVVKNILFMVDTSGSMSKQDITDCYSEINGAIQQYNGKLQGYIGFFDAGVANVVEFDYDTDVTKIVPYGGGGTDFDAIFKYVEDKMIDNLPSSIIILTDGCCPWPKEKATLGIPVLWIINNEEMTPPFGKVARITRK